MRNPIYMHFFKCWRSFDVAHSSEDDAIEFLLSLERFVLILRISFYSFLYELVPLSACTFKAFTYLRTRDTRATVVNVCTGADIYFPLE